MAHAARLIWGWVWQGSRLRRRVLLFCGGWLLGWASGAAATAPAVSLMIGGDPIEQLRGTGPGRWERIAGGADTATKVPLLAHFTLGNALEGNWIVVIRPAIKVRVITSSVPSGDQLTPLSCSQGFMSSG
jgi:hypothetical protein